jgi:hypothetical protein
MGTLTIGTQKPSTKVISINTNSGARIIGSVMGEPLKNGMAAEAVALCSDDWRLREGPAAARITA